jgi:REP element-mobilizing transposase RayT
VSGNHRILDDMTIFDPNVHHRRSIRLKGYDYSSGGMYFFTACTHDRVLLFGRIHEGQMEESDFGAIIRQHWTALPQRFLTIKLDAFVVMPNHVHGIIVLTESVGAGSHRTSSNATGLVSSGEEGGGTPPLQKPGLGSVIGYFKHQAAKQINIRRRTPGLPVWQRGYFARVIRDEDGLRIAREYVYNNPLHWSVDRDNPDFTPQSAQTPNSYDCLRSQTANG